MADNESKTKLTTTKPKQGIREWMDEPETQRSIGSALADWIPRDEFLAQMLIAISDDKIIPCSDESKFKAIHTCAALQLLPTLQQVAFIPHNNTKEINGKECKVLEVTVLPQWQGYKALMERHPDVQEVDAELVFHGDDYKYTGTTRQLHHEFDPFVNRDLKPDLSNIHGGYLRVSYSDHRRDKFHFVTAATILKARNCAKTKTIWTTWVLEMTLKTIFRNGFGRRVVPIDPLVNKRMQRLTDIDDKVLGNDPRRADVNNRSLTELTNEIQQDANTIDA